jgi:hypothetical protein
MLEIAGACIIAGLMLLIGMQFIVRARQHSYAMGSKMMLTYGCTIILLVVFLGAAGILTYIDGIEHAKGH